MAAPITAPARRSSAVFGLSPVEMAATDGAAEGDAIAPTAADEDGEAGRGSEGAIEPDAWIDMAAEGDGEGTGVAEGEGTGVAGSFGTGVAEGFGTGVAEVATVTAGAGAITVSVADATEGSD